MIHDYQKALKSELDLFPTQSLLLDKIMKNKRGPELVTKFGKNPLLEMYCLTKSDVVIYSSF